MSLVESLSHLVRWLGWGERFIRMHWWGIVFKQYRQEEGSGRNALSDSKAAASGAQQEACCGGGKQSQNFQI